MDSHPLSATSTETPASLRIAIVGGGLGGLTLARILQTKGIPCTVFEREASPTARSQGGSLDMHADSGQHALKLAGLFGQFKASASYEADCMRILDKTGQVHMDDQGQTNDRPEIDRKALRQILLDSLLPNTVLWAHTLRDVRPIDKHVHQLVFDNGFVGTYDLVVGADGTWSRVRSLLSQAKPEYAGVTFVELELTNIDAAHPDIAAVVGGGTMFALGDDKALIAQRNSGDRAKVYASLRVPESWAKDSNLPFVEQPNVVRAHLLDLFKDWSPSVTDIITHAEDSFIPRPLYALPTGHAWASKPGVTIIGDAAHVMSPFAGEGANLALLDAAELALAIASGTDLDMAIAQTEKTMCRRAAEAADESAQNLDAFVHPDAPNITMKRLAEVMAKHGPPPE